MNIRQSILAIFTVIFVLLSVIFIGFEAIEIPKDQNALIDSVLDKITPEVKKGKINARTLNTLPPNTFYAIWVEDDSESWIPLIVSEGVTLRVNDGPTWIPQEYAWAARTYLKSSDDVNYIVWINKYNPEFYIKNVIIVSLFLLLFYLILVLVISVLFGSRQQTYDDESDDDDDDISIDDELHIDEKKSSPDDSTQPSDEPAKQTMPDERKTDEKTDADVPAKQTMPDDHKADEKNDSNDVSAKQTIPNEHKTDEKTDSNDVSAKQTIPNEHKTDEKTDSSDVSAKQNSQDDTNNNDTIYEHTIAGDEPTAVKLTSAEFDALTKPIEYDEDEEIDESDPFYIPESMPDIPEVPNLPGEAQKRTDAIIVKYKDLWRKSVKMSNDFKANFGFREVRNIQRLGITPVQYIDKVLSIGQDYFRWEMCDIYVCQDGNLINAVTNEQVTVTNIDITTKGTKKGVQFVPLFPYMSDELFGYLTFEWNSIEPFRLTDVLCYLKLIFDDDTRFIFDNEIQQHIKDDIQNGIKGKGDALLAILTVDNKEKIKLEYDDADAAKLDELIYDKIRKNYKKYITYHITAFKYAIIGQKINKEKSIEAFDKWISNADKHIYSLSPANNAAISFSCGIAYKSDTIGSNSTADNMIERAENLLSVSVNKGGSKISIQK